MIPIRAPATTPSSPRISASVRDRSRGWLGRLMSWYRCRRIDTGAAPAVPQHSLPTRIAGSASVADHQHGLLETRVEPGEVADVGAVLPVGVHDEAVVASFGGHAHTGDPGGRDGRPGPASASGRACPGRAGRCGRPALVTSGLPGLLRQRHGHRLGRAPDDGLVLVHGQREPLSPFPVGPLARAPGRRSRHRDRSGSDPAGRRRARRPRSAPDAGPGRRSGPRPRSRSRPRSRPG